jgi:hypothetical protein
VNDKVALAGDLDEFRIFRLVPATLRLGMPVAFSDIGRPAKHLRRVHVTTGSTSCNDLPAP